MVLAHRPGRLLARSRYPGGWTVTPRAWGLLACLAAVLLLVMCGCGGDALSDSEPACERSAYELERTRYRCTSEGALQTLDCGDWVTLDVCSDPQSCSPGPTPGCD